MLVPPVHIFQIRLLIYSLKLLMETNSWKLPMENCIENPLSLSLSHWSVLFDHIYLIERDIGLVDLSKIDCSVQRSLQEAKILLFT